MSTHTDSPRPDTAELLDLQGRTAIVTGAGMGIGEAIAERLHQAGAAVVVADVAESGAQVARRLERRRSGSAFAVQADVADERDAERLVAATLERFRTLDILVNNAGVSPRVPFLEMEPAVFRRVLDVNLLGVFLCTRAAVRPMLAAGRGKIINITSIDAVHPSMVGLAHDEASKHGVWGFTKNIALELAPHGIQVNAIAPGGIVTPGVGTIPDEALRAFEQAIPMGRMGDPEDIARATLFLASDLSSYMTGSQIVVDGGRLLA